MQTESRTTSSLDCYAEVQLILCKGNTFNIHAAEVERKINHQDFNITPPPATAKTLSLHPYRPNAPKPWPFIHIHIMHRIILFLLSAFLLMPVAYATDWSAYVNVMMGTQSSFELSAGNTYPAIARPWGMNFWTPQTGPMGDGWTYTYTAHRIRGIKQTHQPSPWINDYGQWSIMPVVGRKITEEERQSWFSHKAEIATPYYYSVYLADHDITAEVTPTERAAMFRFTLPETDSAAIVVDAFDQGSWVKSIGRNKLVGYTTRNSGGVPEGFRCYFVAEFTSADVESVHLWKTDGQLTDSTQLHADHTGAYISLRPTRRGEQVCMKVASSFISVEQAEHNLQELGNLSFDELREEGHQAWNTTLGRVAIEAPTDVMRTFYSCLYRSTLFPRRLHEFDALGRMVHRSPYDGKVHQGPMYTDTGMWDTFRSLFPLLNLVYPERNAEIQEGLLNAFLESGFLPEWASPGHRDCMVGNNSASVVADAIVKGVTPQRLWKPLYEAMLKTAHSRHPKISATGRTGWQLYDSLGYVPCDAGINESVARTLEYAYDDWCIGQVARCLERPKSEVEAHDRRAENFRHVFDPSSRFMRGRRTDGTFSLPFNALKWGDDFTEGNAWHYTWSVFHNVPALISLMGGRKAFVDRLDSVFTVPPLFDCSYYGQVIHEIREMQVMNMGNYAHGNQPIQHMIYLYDYAKEPRKAQHWLREVMERFYSATPDGYCGDEDNGQTSAWYVFSALGFYPVCPASLEYAAGTPLVKRATISVPGKRPICITSNGSMKSPYVKRITLNSSTLKSPFIPHPTLIDGGQLVFEKD